MSSGLPISPLRARSRTSGTIRRSSNDERRRAVAKGQDSYAITAPLACAAVERLLEGKFRLPGANAPGFIFDADEMLASLGADNSTFKMIAA
jgi:hypothetical protein